MARVEIVEIDDAHLAEVCRFLRRWIGSRMSAADFSAALARRWADGPRGFLLVTDGAVVGVLGTIRSLRMVRGETREFCNLTCFAIEPRFRTYAAAILRTATRHRDIVYTDFTASAAVVELLRAVGFTALPAVERILVPSLSRADRCALTVVEPEAVARLLCEARPDVANLVFDHRDTRTKWIGVDAGAERGAVALHLMRARKVPLAHVLYASAPDRLARWGPSVQRACRRAWGFHLIAWPEWQFGQAARSIAVRRPRPVMIKGAGVAPSDIDGLYSELTLLPILA